MIVYLFCSVRALNKWPDFDVKPGFDKVYGPVAIMYRSTGCNILVADGNESEGLSNACFTWSGWKEIESRHTSLLYYRLEYAFLGRRGARMPDEQPGLTDGPLHQDLDHR